jgi:hypothetical protein
MTASLPARPPQPCAAPGLRRNGEHRVLGGPFDPGHHDHPHRGPKAASSGWHVQLGCNLQNSQTAAERGRAGLLNRAGLPVNATAVAARPAPRRGAFTSSVNRAAPSQSRLPHAASVYAHPGGGSSHRRCVRTVDRRIRNAGERRADVRARRLGGGADGGGGKGAQTQYPPKALAAPVWGRPHTSAFRVLVARQGWRARSPPARSRRGLCCLPSGRLVARFDGVRSSARNCAPRPGTRQGPRRGPRRRRRRTPPRHSRLLRPSYRCVWAPMRAAIARPTVQV